MSEANKESADNRIKLLKDSLGGINHGTVTLIIQDGRLIQIDTVDKKIK